jgi:hypothetical protein
MKKPGKTTVLWSSIAIINIVFMLLLIWSLVPFGGDTLPHILERFLAISFRTAALLVSLICGMLAVGSMSLTLLAPVPESANRCGNHT